MKKALLIAYYYPPLGGIGSQRPLKFARYLSQYGWQPIVLTVQPENSRAAFVDHSLDSGETQGIQVVRTPAVDLGAWFSRSGASSTQTTSQTTNQTPGSESTASNDINAQSTSQRIRATLQQTARTWAYIPDAQNGWYPSAVAAGKQILRDHDIDVIYSTSYPVTAHFVAQRLKAFSNKPWVADFRDLWSEVHMEGAYASRWRKRLDQRLEARLLNKVDTIITVSDTLATALQRLSGQRKRVEVIRNGFDAADFIDLPHQVSEQWTITFVGTFYSFYNPAPFLAALQRLIQNGSIPREKARFQIVGERNAELQGMAQQFGLEDITHFTGYLPHREALAHQVNSSLLLLIMHRERLNPGIVTGKIFEYLGARRPILAIVPAEFEVAQIVRETHAGVVVEPSDASGIEKALLESYRDFINGNSPQMDADLTSYERSHNTRQLAALFDDLTT